MANIIYTPKEIFEQDFKVSVRGFNRKEVDEFLDDVIKDYETYIAAVEELRSENTRLKEEIKKLKQRPEAAKTASTVTPSVDSTHVAASAATNFDILKRISRLEKEVFGKQISE
ncbi:cell division regulator GpsB [Streptococcus macacae]|uniref:Cell cycle protein GpsB n=1 Tax=Streptococcus macacae NCTC 11558 TaxID=764298 RepID=G5JY17_9STRE|nr:cell division regulator GpsB [Streptococcus macacae]EHJ51894.1 DivIVA domain protein [Streptococcus macacae NCTC 11558]SUN77935.1 DivIV A-like protein [Streptococcus macacae NCTC 11558]